MQARALARTRFYPVRRLPRNFGARTGYTGRHAANETDLVRGRKRGRHRAGEITMRSRLTSATRCGSAPFALLASLSAADASAAIADFVFGEDFEAFPTCASASGFALLASPASRADTL